MSRRVASASAWKTRSTFSCFDSYTTIWLYISAPLSSKEEEMKLTLMEFTSLDGVTQGPGSPDEDTRDGFAAGGWLVPHLDAAFMETVIGWSRQADAFLFGHRTYDNFARD